MIEAKDLIADNDVLYLPPFYHAENGSAKRLTTLLSESFFSDMVAEEAVPYGSQPDNGIVYDEVRASGYTSSVGIKGHGADRRSRTGKTTTTQGIIAAFKSRGMQILLAAQQVAPPSA